MKIKRKKILTFQTKSHYSRLLTIADSYVSNLKLGTLLVNSDSFGDLIFHLLNQELEDDPILYAS